MRWIRVVNSWQPKQDGGPILIGCRRYFEERERESSFTGNQVMVGQDVEDVPQVGGGSSRLWAELESRRRKVTCTSDNHVGWTRHSLVTLWLYRPSQRQPALHTTLIHRDALCSAISPTQLYCVDSAQLVALGQVPINCNGKQLSHVRWCRSWSTVRHSHSNRTWWS
jgi:hypothetical protein